MINAILKGKLSLNEERSEDLLTSCVFDTFRYSRKYELLFSFLKMARSHNNKVIDLHSFTNPIFEFWPFIKFDDCNPSEPDLIIEGQDGKDKILFLIEAKFHSSKSSVADENQEYPTDQLAREYDNLIRLVKDRSATKGYLIYLTAHMDFPYLDVKESEDEFTQKRKDPCFIYWLNWQTLTKLIDQEKETILIELKQLLQRHGLNFFRGIPVIDNAIVENWKKWQFYKKNNLYKWEPELKVIYYPYRFIVNKNQ